MATTLAGLQEKAQFLRNAAPRAFEEFVVEFERHTDTAVKNLLGAVSNLPQLQGRAQECRSLCEMLKAIK